MGKYTLHPTDQSVKGNKHALKCTGKGQIGIGWDDQKEGGRVYHSRPTWKEERTTRTKNKCARVQAFL